MNRFDLISFASADALAGAVSSAWLDEIVAANRSGRPHFVALSGGRITLKFFAAVIEQSKARDISLSNVHFFWADERCVPPDDKESSYAAAAEYFFRPLGIAPDKIHRILGELPPERAAQLATEEILSVVPFSPPSTRLDEEKMHGAQKAASSFPEPTPSPSQEGNNVRASDVLLPSSEGLGVGSSSGKETGSASRQESVNVQPVLDIVFLGMGEDGHVASLFPDEPEAARLNPAIYRAISNSPKPPPNRVTLGYDAIAAAKNVWVLASGAGKEAVLRESLSPEGKTPLARVLKMCAAAKVFTDIKV